MFFCFSKVSLDLLRKKLEVRPILGETFANKVFLQNFLPQTWQYFLIFC